MIALASALNRNRQSQKFGQKNQLLPFAIRQYNCTKIFV
nr:MAG TPA: hypothetical protein [Caudoviricetes sp.]